VIKSFKRVYSADGCTPVSLSSQSRPLSHGGVQHFSEDAGTWKNSGCKSTGRFVVGEVVNRLLATKNPRVVMAAGISSLADILTTDVIDITIIPHGLDTRYNTVARDRAYDKSAFIEATASRAKTVIGRSALKMLYARDASMIV